MVAFSLGMVARAAALGGLETPHGQQYHLKTNLKYFGALPHASLKDKNNTAR